MNDVFEHLLRLIELEKTRLASKRSVTLDAYLTDWETQHIVERAFQETIQACIDLGARLISRYKMRTGTDYHDIFTVLAEESVLELELTGEMKEMAGFRNALVHEYRRIRHEEVWRHLQESLGRFEKYARSVLEFLEKNGDLPGGLSES